MKSAVCSSFCEARGSCTAIEMIISGFQKLTLLDYPEKVACVIFLRGCNFRCPFCHNADLVNGGSAEGVISEEEVFGYIAKRRRVLDGVCVTGGEPLMNPDINAFLKRLHDTGLAVKLDTNGSFPERLEEVAASGNVDYIAMDIKSSESGYDAAAGTKTNASAIGRSIDFLLRGTIDYEFRTTVVNELHGEEEIAALCARIKGAKRYFLQNFVDSGNLVGNVTFTPCPLEKMHVFLEVARRFVPETEIRSI